ncbi:hypothetical protein GCM10010052_42170 [Paenarthrobacter histidinolovorans]|nr:hypothetical protein GCM10010052_42170 [Paenarthrobacter histidinolovorans]
MNTWSFASSGFRNTELDEAARHFYYWTNVLVPSTKDCGYMEIGSRFGKDVDAYGEEMERRRSALIKAQQRVDRLVTKHGLRAQS